jgi:hypothetical protein
MLWVTQGILLKMHSGNSAIRFIFDTNAFSYIADRSDYETIVDLIERQNKQIIPHLSLFNLYEYVKGISSVVILKKRKEYIRRIRRITLGATVFPDTITHLQLVSGQITRQEAAKNSQALLGLVNNFMAINNVRGLRTAFDSFINNTAILIRDMTESSLKVRDSISNEISTSANAKQFRAVLSRPPDDAYIDIIAPHLLNERYKLDVNYSPEEREQIFSKFPSIKYMCDVYWIYFGYLAINNAKPKESDIFDMAQLVYLNIADYYVTRDKKLRDRINHPDNPDLYKRAISPQEFISMLDSRLVVKRAPQHGLSIWVDAPF